MPIFNFSGGNIEIFHGSQHVQLNSNADGSTTVRQLNGPHRSNARYQFRSAAQTSRFLNSVLQGYTPAESYRWVTGTDPPDHPRQQRVNQPGHGTTLRSARRRRQAQRLRAAQQQNEQDASSHLTYDEGSSTDIKGHNCAEGVKKDEDTDVKIKKEEKDFGVSNNMAEKSNGGVKDEPVKSEPVIKQEPI